MKEIKQAKVQKVIQPAPMRKRVGHHLCNALKNRAAALSYWLKK